MRQVPKLPKEFYTVPDFLISLAFWSIVLPVAVLNPYVKSINLPESKSEFGAVFIAMGFILLLLKGFLYLFRDLRENTDEILYIVVAFGYGVANPNITYFELGSIIASLHVMVFVLRIGAVIIDWYMEYFKPVTKRKNEAII